MSLLTISNCRFSIFIIGDIEMVFFVLRLNIQILTAGKGTIEQKKPTKQKMKNPY